MRRVAYSDSVDFPFDKALALARAEYPFIDYGNVSDVFQLEAVLAKEELVLFVDVDENIEVQTFLDKEKTTQTEVDDEIDNYCAPNTVQTSFTDADLVIPCDDPPEFPADVVIDQNEVNDLIKELQDIIRENDGGLSEGKSLGDIDKKSDIGKIVGCIGEMQDITAQLRVLIDKETKVKETVVNLEEFLYNYRLMEDYFKTRVDTLNSILGLFKPLIEHQRELENRLIPAKTAQITDTKKDLSDYRKAKYDNVNGSSDGTIDQKETEYLADIKTENFELDAFKEDLDQTKAQIQLDRDGIYSFNDEFLQYDQTNSTKVEVLKQKLQDLFGSSGTAFSTVSQFSTRTIFDVSSGFPPNFQLKFQHEIKDDAGILTGLPLVFSKSGDSIEINSFNGSLPSGTLYNSLYNIWGDPEKFFTREERGLTQNSNQMAVELKDTGVLPVNGNFIANLNTYEDFQLNFQIKHKQKTQLIKDTVIEPSLVTTVSGLREVAIKEIQYLLSFGLAFQYLPADDAQLQNIIYVIIDTSDRYTKRVQELRDTLTFAQAQHDKVLLDIEFKKLQYSTVSCADGASNNSKDKCNPPKPGSDPLGKDFQSINPKSPDFTKYCYWLEFAKFATAVNLLPLPGNGGLKYWPIGFTVATPAGLVKIPLPIVWIPIAVIALPVGTFVIFIGQCGVCPSPFVFYIGPNGEKKFIISLRSGDQFGADASEPMLKAFDKGGIAVSKTMSAMLNDVKIPGFSPLNNPDTGSNLMEDIKDKILKKVQKLGVPSIAPILSLNAKVNATEQRAAYKKTVMDYLSKLDIPNMKFPKNAQNVNPKPTPVSEVIDNLLKNMKMSLPQISIPPIEKLSLKTKLLSEIGNMKAADIAAPDLVVPNKNTPDYETKNAEFLSKFKVGLNSVLSKSMGQFTPQNLGLISTVNGRVSFFAPYKCCPTTTGIGIPSIPSELVNGIIALNGLSLAAVGAISSGAFDKLYNTMGSPAIITPDFYREFLTNILFSIPNVEVPNPSKISIKDMLKESSLKMIKMQLPSLPDPTKPPQLRITFPGSAIRSAILKGVEATLDALDVGTINFSTVSEIDVKQQVVSLVEESFAPVEETLGPFLNIISKYKASKDKTFPELIGMKPPQKDDNQVLEVQKDLLAAAKKLLTVLSIIPYPAVAVAPQLFSKLHPIMSNDDLPAWERLSLRNFLFVCFLDQWCIQGKKGGGLYENP